MSLLTVDKSKSYESICTKLLQNKEIQCAGFVNKKGRIVAGCFDNSRYVGFDEEYGLDVFLMETALEFSMKNEFNNRFGTIEYVFSKRDCANITCMPIHDNILVIITRGSVHIQEILESYTPGIQKLFEENSDESL